MITNKVLTKTAAFTHCAALLLATLVAGCDDVRDVIEDSRKGGKAPDGCIIVGEEETAPPDVAECPAVGAICAKHALAMWCRRDGRLKPMACDPESQRWYAPIVKPQLICPGDGKDAGVDPDAGTSL